MKKTFKTLTENFLSNFKKKSRSEVIEDLIQNCVKNLTENGSQLTNSEIALIALETKLRVKEILIQRQKSLNAELKATSLSINTL